MSNVIYKNTRYVNTDALENIVSYALRCDKVDLDSSLQSVAWSGQGIITKTPKMAINSFRTVKQIFTKNDGNQLHHVIITFKTRQVMKPITTYDAIKIMSEVGYGLLVLGFQNMYFVHNEYDSIHVHFVINSINFLDGRRISRLKDLTHNIVMKLYQLTPMLEWNFNVIYKNSNSLDFNSEY